MENHLTLESKQTGKRDEIARSMTILDREQNNVDGAMRLIQIELRRIHLQLL
jgi:hypothetical protein